MPDPTPTNTITPTRTPRPTSTPTPSPTRPIPPSMITKKIQLFRFLGSNNLTISSLSNNILSNINSIYSIDNSGSWVSWQSSGISTLTTLEKYKTYLIINNSNSPNYSLYNNTDIIDNISYTTINSAIAIETYRGSIPILINNASWKNNIDKIIGIDSSGSSYISWDKSIPSNLNSLTVLQPNTGYLLFNNTVPFVLWSETLRSSNNWTYRYNNFLALRFIPNSSGSTIELSVPIISLSTLPETGDPAPIPSSCVVTRAGTKIGDLLFISAYNNKTINAIISGVSYSAVINNGQINF